MHESTHYEIDDDFRTGEKGDMAKTSGAKSGAETTLSDESLSALKAFAEGLHVMERVDALKRLFTAKQMAAARQRNEFAAGVTGLAECARDTDARPTDRLEAFAALVRLRSARADEAQMEVLLGQAAQAGPLPPVDLLEDSENQARVLATLRVLDVEWATGHALPFTALDVPRSNTRLEAIETVLSRAESAEAGIEAIADELNDRESTLPPSTFGRIALYTLQDLEKVLRRTATPFGTEPARGLVRMAEVFRGHGLRELPPHEQGPIVGALAGLTRLAASSRLRFALTASSYAALQILRDLFSNNWLVLADREENLLRVRDDVAEALYVQVRAGSPDEPLREVLKALHRDDGSHRDTLRKLSREPGVSADMARWLTGERAISSALRQSIDEVGEEAQRERMIDLLLAAQEAELWQRSQGADLIPRSLVVPVVDQVISLMDRRGIVARGDPGDRVPFDPVRHHPVDIPPEGLSIVRLLTSVVVEARSTGDVVVRRAIVEAAP